MLQPSSAGAFGKGVLKRESQKLLETSRCSTLKGHFGSYGQGTMMGLYICPNCLVLTTPLSLRSLSHLADEETKIDVYMYKEVWKEWAASTNGQAAVGLLFLPPVSYACIWYQSSSNQGSFHLVFSLPPRMISRSVSSWQILHCFLLVLIFVVSIEAPYHLFPTFM